MTGQIVVAAVVVAAAAVVAIVVRRRQRVDPPTQRRLSAPEQLDRDDFAGLVPPRLSGADRSSSGAGWLVVVFSSASCGTCADVWRKAQVLASDEVDVVEVEYAAHPDVHRRYGVEAVPTLVVADRDGVVRASFLGPVTATDLWAAYARARDGGDPSSASDAG